jgi:hypothetical protein
MMVMMTMEAREAARQRARQRARDRDWQQALDGAGLGRRAVAARIVAQAARPTLDLCHWSAEWLAALGCTNIRPAGSPFLLVGDLHDDRILLAAAPIDDGCMALTARLLAVLASDVAAAEARAGARIVVVGFDRAAVGFPRPTVQWLEADQFGPWG